MAGELKVAADSKGTAESKSRANPYLVDPPIRLHDLVRDPDDRLLRAAYATILRPAFRGDELQSLDSLRGQVRRAEGLRAVVAVDEADEPIGVISADWYPRSRSLLLGYLAVRADARGKGVGTALVAGTVPGWIESLRPELGVAEVADPRRVPTDGSRAAWNRVRLFQALGARVIDIPYFQPRLAAGTGRVHGLMLMAFATGGRLLAEEPSGSVSGTAVRAFLSDYFAAYEGDAEPAGDPDLSGLLGHAAGGAPLALAELAQPRSAS